nr:ribonuclease H-like domain, reverse transcriptase, RNA-dependent DNA polymerase [Tanacetum cinerariifolium]
MLSKKFGDSYEVPGDVASTGSASDGTGKKKGRTITLTTDDMKKRKNDVKARTTLLLSLPDEHQLRFSKYKTTQELWVAILKTFDGNEDTKKTKKNLLKQQYGNFKAEGSETLEQTFNRLQIDEDDIEEMDIKLNMALLIMRADRFWKKTGKKISIQGIDVAGFDKLKVECFNCHKMGHFVRECRAPRSQDRGRRDNYRQGYMANDEENHALIDDEETLIEFALMAKTSAESEVFDNSLCSKASEHRNQELKYCEKIRVLEFKTESRENCIESLTKDLELLKKEKDKNKEGLGYSAVSPPLTQVYSPPKKDMSWTGLPEFKDDTVTDYSRPSPTIESTLDNAQNRNPFVTKTEASPSTISPKHFIKFVKANDSPTKSKIDKVETAKKPPVKYAKQYRKPTKKPNVRGNQRNWKNLKSHQLGPNFVMKKKACFNCGDFNHLAYDCSKRGSSQNNIDDKGYWDSGCSRHMTDNISYLSDYDPFDRGYVSFSQGGCKITGKGTIKTDKLKDFKLLDDANVLLRTPRQHNMYSIDLNNIVPHKDLTCLVAKASADQVNKSHNKTPYELFNGRTPALGFLKPFGCHVMILNTLDNLGKFEAKGDEGFFIGYSMSSKAFRVFNKRTKRVEENLHVDFLENKAIEKGTNSTNFLGTKDATSQKVKKDVSSLRYIALPNWDHDALLESSSSKPQDDCNADVLESSGNLNPTATSTNPPGDQIETLTVETPIPTFEDIPVVTINSDKSNGVEADSLVDCPKGVRPIGTKWVLKNKKDERGIAIRNKARLVAQGHTQEKGIDYKEVFAPVARIEAIRLFLAYASFIGFTVYQMDVKSAFLYGTIDEEVLLEPVLHKEDGIFLSHDKYVGDILKKFRYSDVRSANTPMDKENPWGKDETRKDVDLHLYRSMIGSLMYLTASRPDIMFAVCSCARHKVTPKECHLHAVKRIFRYLKCHPKLGLWYPKESPFDLVAYSDSNYGGATQDRKSTTRGCQFLGRRLISWQCKKQTIVATSTTEAEYIVAASYCGQVLDCFEKKLISVDYIHTDENVADLLTKPFDAGRFHYLVSEHNVDFHPIVDFIEASHLRYALTFKPTVYVSHIRQFWSTARIETTKEGTKILATIDGRIVPLFDSMLTPQGERSGTPTEPHHTPSAEAQQTSPTTHSSPTLPLVTTTPIPTVTPSDTPHLRQYTKRAKIAQSSALPPIADEPTSPLRDSDLVSKFEARELEITMLKTRVKLLEDREGGVAERFGDDAPIKGRRLDEGEEAAKKGSKDTEEMINVLTSIDAATVLSSGVAEVPTSSDSIPTVGPPAIGVPTGSNVLEEEMERDAQRINEQIAREAEIGRIHAEEELQIMIDGLDRSNETVAKYQDNYAKVYKYQSQQRKPLTKKQQKEFYTSVLRNQAGWKAKDFKGMTLEDIKENFNPESVKKLKTSKEVKATEEVLEEKVKEMIQLIPVKEITRLGGSSANYQFFVDMLKHLDREDLNKLWRLVKESLNIRPTASDKEMELWVELKRLYELDDEDQLWTHTQNIMHALVEWNLYDSCGVHHVTFKDKEMFMLVEKDYPLRKGLAIVMISYKLQVENYSQMASDLILKIYKIPNCPRQEDD